METLSLRHTTLVRMNSIPSGSSSGSASAPTTSSSLFIPYPLCAFALSAQNRRPHQEDRFAFEEWYHRGDFAQHVLLFAVFDGHGGAQVSDALREHMPGIICKCTHEIPHDCPLVDVPDQCLRDAMHKACDIMQGILTDVLCTQHRTTGSTANIVLVILNNNNNNNNMATTPPRIVCVNVGDSRGIMCHRHDDPTTVTPLSDDHKPGASYEQARIVQLGGYVATHPDLVDSYYYRAATTTPLRSFFSQPLRVWHPQCIYQSASSSSSSSSFLRGPGLSVSRSFGDVYAVSYGLTHQPDVRIIWTPRESHRQQHCFIVIASDGLWDVMSSDDVAFWGGQIYDQYAHTIHQSLSAIHTSLAFEGSADPAAAARVFQAHITESVTALYPHVQLAHRLYHIARQRNASDNITIAVVTLF